MLCSLLCRDVQQQMEFYAAVFGFAEVTASRTPIYRGLDTGSSVLGFNAPEARGLLNLPEAPALSADGLLPPTAFATFMLERPAEVDAAAQRALAHGGRVLKAPFATYYKQWQAVLADPEGHVFRIGCVQLPAPAQPASRA